MSLSNWKPTNKRTNEDDLLLQYWEKTGGIIFTEVLVGKGGIRKWTGDVSPRRIDGVQIIFPHKTNGLPDDIVTFRKRKNFQEFQEVLNNGQVKVIEVKYSLNRPVLGQVIAGADLMEIEYNLSNIGQIVICEVGDSALEAVCKKRNIEVWIPSKK